MNLQKSKAEFEDRLRAQVKKALALDAVKHKKGFLKPYTRYPKLAELRQKAPEHIRAVHAQHVRAIERKIKQTGTRWHYCTETHKLTANQ